MTRHLLAALLGMAATGPLAAQRADCRALIASGAPLTAASANALAVDCGDEGRTRLIARYRSDTGRVRGHEVELVEALLPVRSPALLDAALARLTDWRVGRIGRTGALVLIDRQWNAGGGPDPELLRDDPYFTEGRGRRDTPYRFRQELPPETLTRTAAVLRERAAWGENDERLRERIRHVLSRLPLPAPRVVPLTAVAESALVEYAGMSTIGDLSRAIAHAVQDTTSRWWKITLPRSGDPARWERLERRLRTLLRARDSMPGDSGYSILRIDGAQLIENRLSFRLSIGFGRRCAEFSTWMQTVVTRTLEGTIRGDTPMLPLREVGWMESLGC